MVFGGIELGYVPHAITSGLSVEGTAYLLRVNAKNANKIKGAAGVIIDDRYITEYLPWVDIDTNGKVKETGRAEEEILETKLLKLFVTSYTTGTQDLQIQFSFYRNGKLVRREEPYDFYAKQNFPVKIFSDDSGARPNTIYKGSYDDARSYQALLG